MTPGEIMLILKDYDLGTNQRQQAAEEIWERMTAQKHEQASQLVKQLSESGPMPLAADEIVAAAYLIEQGRVEATDTHEGPWLSLVHPNEVRK
jgi:hypothetical protein